MWDGFNKRKFPRVNLRCEIIILPGTQTAPLSTVTENLGTGGVCVILEEPLERFSQCRVRLELEETQPAIECLGRVVWSVSTKDLGGRKNRFDTGIEFLNPDPAATEAIRQFIEKHPEKKLPETNRR